MIRNVRRIDAALEAGGVTAQSAGRVLDAERLLAYLVLAEVISPERAAAQTRPQVGAIDWQAVAAIDQRIAAESSVARRIALHDSLPDWLAEALVRGLGERAEEIAGSLSGRASMTLRANTLVGDREQLRAALAEDGVEVEPTRFARDGLVASGRSNLFALSSYKRGGFEVQDEGSQLIAALCAPPLRSLVVDYCAGAGGKTLALAAALENRGRVVASDTDARKLQELRRRVKRAHASNVQVLTLPPDGTWPAALAALQGTVQRVLVDAPCSAVGTMRRHPELRWRLSADEAARYPALQFALCERSLALLAPGGELIYATCTLLRDENQGVIERLLAVHPNLSLVPASERVSEIWGAAAAAALCVDEGRYLRVDPAAHGTDGFFAAVLRLSQPD
ncbi:RsmB/NOP family class I SAM-dependent RNA methyltransferase [Haliangium ochraceum]|nr:RsmB/NOP family class I SAM-dependent RNA methyltransferase [Haliangium ochraceum]